jgi:hypothetical protein
MTLPQPNTRVCRPLASSPARHAPLSNGPQAKGRSRDDGKTAKYFFQVLMQIGGPLSRVDAFEIEC